MRISRVLGFLLVATTPLAACRSVNPQTPAMIEFERSGGITGRTVKLVVQENGEARLSTRADTSAQVIPPDTLAQLKNLLAKINFDSLQAEYRPAQPGADRFEYVIRYRNRQVRCFDGTVPPELQPLVSLLNRLAVARG